MKVAVLALAAAVCLTGEATVVMEKVEDGASFDAPTTEAFTASAWFKIETRRNEKGRHRYPRLFQFPGGYLQMSNPIHYDTMPSGDAILSIDVPGGTDPKGESRWLFPESIPFRQWVHLTLVVRADPSFAPELYVNGVRVPTRFGPRPMPTAFPAGRFALGNRRKGGVGYPFDGSMAGFRYEPRAIGSAAIAEMVGAAPDDKLPKPFEVRLRDELPVIDFSRDTSIQTVIASGKDEKYQGHPTTSIAPDGTIFCVWTIGHGGSCGPMAKSTDGGVTWERCDGVMPASYEAVHRNCPTLQLVPRPDGGTNVVVFATKWKDYPHTKAGCGVMVSSDNGKTWHEAPTLDLFAAMPPTAFMPLKDGTSAIFGQLNPKVANRGTKDDQIIWMSISRDGGETWGPRRTVAAAPNMNLCEPFCLRSPDGNELCLLIREEWHTGRSAMCFSRDEGKTWTKPEYTCWGLTGDRHEGVYLPDGRLFIAFRDQALGSSTKGQYVAWVGSYDDLRAGRPGDCRVHILEQCGDHAWDTGYSGVEMLPDGTILCTTYLRYRPKDKWNSVVCARIPFARIAGAKLDYKK